MSEKSCVKAEDSPVAEDKQEVRAPRKQRLCKQGIDSIKKILQISNQCLEKEKMQNLNLHKLCNAPEIAAKDSVAAANDICTRKDDLTHPKFDGIQKDYSCEQPKDPRVGDLVGTEVCVPNGKKQWENIEQCEKSRDQNELSDGVKDVDKSSDNLGTGSTVVGKKGPINKEEEISGNVACQSTLSTYIESNKKNEPTRRFGIRHKENQIVNKVANSANLQEKKLSKTQNLRTEASKSDSKFNSYESRKDEGNKKSQCRRDNDSKSTHRFGRKDDSKKHKVNNDINGNIEKFSNRSSAGDASKGALQTGSNVVEGELANTSNSSNRSDWDKEAENYRKDFKATDGEKYFEWKNSSYVDATQHRSKACDVPYSSESNKVGSYQKYPIQSRGRTVYPSRAPSSMYGRGRFDPQNCGSSYSVHSDRARYSDWRFGNVRHVQGFRGRGNSYSGNREREVFEVGGTSGKGSLFRICEDTNEEDWNVESSANAYVNPMLGTDLSETENCLPDVVPKCNGTASTDAGSSPGDTLKVVVSSATTVVIGELEHESSTDLIITRDNVGPIPDTSSSDDTLTCQAMTIIDSDSAGSSSQVLPAAEESTPVCSEKLNEQSSIDKDASNKIECAFEQDANNIGHTSEQGASKVEHTSEQGASKVECTSEQGASKVEHTSEQVASIGCTYKQDASNMGCASDQGVSNIGSTSETASEGYFKVTSELSNVPMQLWCTTKQVQAEYYKSLNKKKSEDSSTYESGSEISLSLSTNAFKLTNISTDLSSNSLVPMKSESILVSSSEAVKTRTESISGQLSVEISSQDLPQVDPERASTSEVPAIHTSDPSGDSLPEVSNHVVEVLAHSQFDSRPLDTVSSNADCPPLFESQSASPCHSTGDNKEAAEERKERDRTMEEHDAGNTSIIAADLGPHEDELISNAQPLKLSISNYLPPSPPADEIDMYYEGEYNAYAIKHGVDEITCKQKEIGPFCECIEAGILECCIEFLRSQSCSTVTADPSVTNNNVTDNVYGSRDGEVVCSAQLQILPTTGPNVEFHSINSGTGNTAAAGVMPESHIYEPSSRRTSVRPQSNDFISGFNCSDFVNASKTNLSSSIKREPIISEPIGSNESVISETIDSSDSTCSSSFLREFLLNTSVSMESKPGVYETSSNAERLHNTGSPCEINSPSSECDVINTLLQVESSWCENDISSESIGIPAASLSYGFHSAGSHDIATSGTSVTMANVVHEGSASNTDYRDCNWTVMKESSNSATDLSTHEAMIGIIRDSDVYMTFVRDVSDQVANKLLSKLTGLHIRQNEAFESPSIQRQSSGIASDASRASSTVLARSLLSTAKGVPDTLDNVVSYPSAVENYSAVTVANRIPAAMPQVTYMQHVDYFQAANRVSNVNKTYSNSPVIDSSRYASTKAPMHAVINSTTSTVAVNSNTLTASRLMPATDLFFSSEAPVSSAVSTITGSADSYCQISTAATSSSTTANIMSCASTDKLYWGPLMEWPYSAYSLSNRSNVIESIAGENKGVKKASYFSTKVGSDNMQVQVELCSQTSDYNPEAHFSERINPKLNKCANVDNQLGSNVMLNECQTEMYSVRSDCNIRDGGGGLLSSTDVDSMGEDRSRLNWNMNCLTESRTQRNIETPGTEERLTDTPVAAESVERLESISKTEVMPALSDVKANLKNSANVGNCIMPSASSRDAAAAENAVVDLVPAEVPKSTIPVLVTMDLCVQRNPVAGISIKITGHEVLDNDAKTPSENTETVSGTEMKAEEFSVTETTLTEIITAVADSKSVVTREGLTTNDRTLSDVSVDIDHREKSSTEVLSLYNDPAILNIVVDAAQEESYIVDKLSSSEGAAAMTVCNEVTVMNEFQPAAETFADTDIQLSISDKLFLLAGSKSVETMNSQGIKKTETKDLVEGVSVLPCEVIPASVHEVENDCWGQGWQDERDMNASLSPQSTDLYERDDYAGQQNKAAYRGEYRPHNQRYTGHSFRSRGNSGSRSSSIVSACRPYNSTASRRQQGRSIDSGSRVSRYHRASGRASYSQNRPGHSRDAFQSYQSSCVPILCETEKPIRDDNEGSVVVCSANGTELAQDSTHNVKATCNIDELQRKWEIRRAKRQELCSRKSSPATGVVSGMEPVKFQSVAMVDWSVGEKQVLIRPTERHASTRGQTVDRRSCLEQEYGKAPWEQLKLRSELEFRAEERKPAQESNSIDDILEDDECCDDGMSTARTTPESWRDGNSRRPWKQSDGNGLLTDDIWRNVVDSCDLTVDESCKESYKEQFCNFEEPFIDSHCHMDLVYKDLKYRESFETFRRERSYMFPPNYAGCVTVFCNPSTWPGMSKDNGLFDKLLMDSNVWGAVGCHPKCVQEYSDLAEVTLNSMLRHSKVKALGEIGLDYSGSFWKVAEKQKEILARQAKLAVELGKPIVIHSRNAEHEILPLMQTLVPHDYRIHRHCFLGWWFEAKRWLIKFPNSYIGLTPAVTNRQHSSYERARDVAINVPLDRLLLETDAPYFIPRNIRKPVPDIRCSHPGMAISVAVEVARLRSIPVEQVLSACYQNTKRMYDIE